MDEELIFFHQEIPETFPETIKGMFPYSVEKGTVAISKYLDFFFRVGNLFDLYRIASARVTFIALSQEDDSKHYIHLEQLSPNLHIHEAELIEFGDIDDLADKMEVFGSVVIHDTYYFKKLEHSIMFKMALC